MQKYFISAVAMCLASFANAYPDNAVIRTSATGSDSTTVASTTQDSTPTIKDQIFLDDMVLNKDFDIKLEPDSYYELSITSKLGSSVDSDWQLA